MRGRKYGLRQVLFILAMAAGALAAWGLSGGGSLQWPALGAAGGGDAQLAELLGR